MSGDVRSFGQPRELFVVVSRRVDSQLEDGSGSEAGPLDMMFIPWGYDASVVGADTVELPVGA